MLRITNISYSTKIFKNKIKVNKTKNAVMALPIISTPLVAYYSVKENKNMPFAESLRKPFLFPELS